MPGRPTLCTRSQCMYERIPHYIHCSIHLDILSLILHPSFPSSIAQTTSSYHQSTSFPCIQSSPWITSPSPTLLPLRRIAPRSTRIRPLRSCGVLRLAASSGWARWRGWRDVARWETIRLLLLLLLQLLGIWGLAPGLLLRCLRVGGRGCEGEVLMWLWLRMLGRLLLWVGRIRCLVRDWRKVLLLLWVLLRLMCLW